MKISVRVRDEWLHIPCKDGKGVVRWLAEEALKRYQKLRTSSHVPSRKEIVSEIRKTRGGAILDPQDIIQDVLDDNDFVSVVLESDWPDPALASAEIMFVPEQVVKNFQQPVEYLKIDGNSLSTDDLRQLGKGRYKIKLSTDSEMVVIKSRNLVEKILAENKVVYGITTGFGKFARTVIEKDKLVYVLFVSRLTELLQLNNYPVNTTELRLIDSAEGFLGVARKAHTVVLDLTPQERELQVNLIRSHSAGVGHPLSPKKARMLLALRINVLAKGYSGIQLKTLHQLIDAFNVSCLPWIPEQGTVGASGDLAPLAHLALGLMGEGKMWSPETGWGDAKYVLEAHNLTPISLEAKEGLALINGTQLITSLGAEAVERAGIIARQADVVAALTLEVLKGTSTAFDAGVQEIRPHKGQGLVARRLRALLHSAMFPSQIAESHRFCNRVQDAYTLRCCPQVHGIVHDTIDFVRGVITTEMNSATDNPIVFAERNEIISAGNFHGEYPAKVLDYLAIGVHELAAMSERRTERLVNPALSELPAFLVKDGGLNSGFMIAHCTAASLVSENKVLCHPASVDSLSTSAGTEDHVSMGGFAARKALQVVQNVEKVIAIELLAACQAIEFLRPLKTTIPLEEVYRVVRSAVRPWGKDRVMSPDIDAVTQILQEEKVWQAVKTHVEEYNATQHVELDIFSPTMSVSRSIPELGSPKSTSTKLVRTVSASTSSPPTKRKRQSGGTENNSTSRTNVA